MVANTQTNDKPQTPHDYYAMGLLPVPIPHRTKKCVLDGWPSFTRESIDLDALFPDDGEQRGIGISLGASGISDVDLDCQEAVAVAPLLLPPSGWIFGRKSNPASHWEYRTTGRSVQHKEYRQADGEKLVELRSGKHMTVFPPSIHEDDEPITWERFDGIGECSTDDLEIAAGRVAAATILARHWPSKGSRHDARLALAGGVLRAGMSEDEAASFVLAVCTASRCQDLGDCADVVRSTARKLDTSENVKGWPSLAELVGDEVVRRACRWLGVKGRDTEPADVPLPVEPPWPDPPGAEAFFGLPGRIVHVIEPASEADPAALLIQTLLMFGNVIGRGPHFFVEGTRHHTNEYAVLVGKTSKARKGTSWDRVHRLFREMAEEWANERIQSGLSSSEGLIWAVRDPISKREKVNNGKGQAPSYEEVQADPGIEDKRLCVYEPEFANVLKQTERTGNTLSTVLRQGWDGGHVLRTMTKNAPARATGAHVSLIGHITAVELRRSLSATETANGFANRFLWLCVDRAQLLPEGGSVDSAAWETLRTELVEALTFATSVGELHRDDDARALWREVYGPLSEGRPGLAGALLARAEAHVLRLSMIYALMDLSATIQAPHLLAAMALWDFCERSVYYVFGDLLGDPIADELLRLLRSSPEGLTRTDMMHYFGNNKSSERIGRGLGMLLQHGLLRRESQSTGGRPAERWFAATRQRT